MNQKKTVHITSQGKGGVYKSGSAALLAQFLHDKGHEVKAFDTDPTNATLSHFKGLNVLHVNVTEGNAVDIQKFHDIANRIVGEDGPFVIDTGATIFLSFWEYVGQTGLIDFLDSQDRRVVIHCPVMGGQELAETLKGFSAICQMMPADSIVVWANTFHGEVEGNGKTFEEFTVVRENADKLLGIVRLGDPVGSLRGKALQSLSETNRTFKEAMADSSIGLVERHVLHGVRKTIWDQLEGIF
ncbi:MAG: conjugal transfer protein TraL [Bryobacterales bacterium]|nr:conjugal transfer protein TraL [Bryobacterales bacterium]